MLCFVIWFTFNFNSEILLAAEAHIITYVNKEGIRSDHTLQNAIQSGNIMSAILAFLQYNNYDILILIGRVDVIKRLKYAKDIMHKLINAGTAPEQN